MAAITYLTKDDPPAMLAYSSVDRDADPKTNMGHVVHHPRFGIVLKKHMDELGIECVVQYRGNKGGIVRHGGGQLIQRTAFIREQFKKADKQ